MYIHEEEEEQEKITSPPSSLTILTTSPSKEVFPRIQKTRSIKQLYEVTDELNLICLLANQEIISYKEAKEDERWRKAMDEEIKAIEKNDTWEYVNLLKGHEPVGVKWVYKIKKNA